MSKFKFTGGKQVASTVTQIWYSLRLSEEDFQLVIRTLQELIEASSLYELTGGAMKMNQRQFQRIAEVWRTWLQLSSRKGGWITEARRKPFQALEGMNLYLEEIPEEHKKSASDWFADGILLPRASRKELPRENFTLTGSDFQFSRNKGEFTYKIQSSVTPFSGWDYKDVRQLGHSPLILKMYSEYVSHVLEKCALKLASGQVKFHFLYCATVWSSPHSFLKTRSLTESPPQTLPTMFLWPNFLTSVITPLLNPINPSSVIITEFHNWVQHTNLMEEARATG